MRIQEQQMAQIPRFQVYKKTQQKMLTIQTGQLNRDFIQHIQELAQTDLPLSLSSLSLLPTLLPLLLSGREPPDLALRPPPWAEILLLPLPLSRLSVWLVTVTLPPYESRVCGARGKEGART